MRSDARAIVLTLVACVAATALPAAERPALGTQVRALGPDGIEIRGTLTAYGADDLTIAPRQGGERVTLGFDRLERLRVPDGRDYAGGFAKGALLGIALAVVGAVVKMGEVEACLQGGCAVYAAFYSLFTIPVGGLVGTAAAPERWRDVWLPALAHPPSPRLGVSIKPVKGGARFALSYGF
jgi:hypothetical protein